MFYPEDQYVDMLRVENEYISELLEFEEYFKIEGETVYLKDGITKTGTVPVAMKMPTSFMILDESGTIIKEQNINFDEIFGDDALEYIINQEDKHAYYPVEYDKYPYFLVNSTFATKVDGQDKKLKLISVLSAQDLGKEKAFNKAVKLLLFAVAISFILVLTLFIISMYFINKKILPPSEI